MICRPLIPLTILASILTIFPVGKNILLVQSAVSPSTHFVAAPIVVAKKAPSRKGRSSSLIVNNVRHHNHKKYTRVVLDLPARAIIRETKNADTATIKLAKSQLSKRAIRKIQSTKFPKAISIEEGAGKTVTITLDLNALRKFDLQTLRKPNRVVIDLFYSKKKTVVASKKKAAPFQEKNKPVQKPVTPVPKTAPPSRSEIQVNAESPPPVSPETVAKHAKDLIVVIDPGHGGKDPGAIGKKGTKEKDVTLKIGIYLKDLIQNRLGSRVILTRNKDVFLGLEERVAFANRKKADLFISIHVNSHPQKKIKGLEVYHFGKASDPRALEVAARENGMKLEDNAPPWQFIIADKLNDQKIEQSQTFAWTTNKTLVKTLKASYKIKDHGVKTAPFYVLRFTTMPSILAEVAFVSNPDDEKRLKTKTFQRKLAEGIYKGIQSYLKTALPTLS